MDEHREQAVEKSRSARFFHRFGPGLLVAATGVGAGDLVNATLAGAELGLLVLWAAWIGSLLKWLLNEGIARWQLATGRTLLDAWCRELPKGFALGFGVYLLLWTLAVGSTIMKACGVAAASLFATGEASVFWWTVAHTLVGAGLVLRGGFQLFERAMSFFIGLMFISVIGSAVWVCDFTDPGFWSGLTIPTIPAGGLGWTLGVLGGVGGTVTLLSYGYWIAEQGRKDPSELKTCWWDLAAGYAMTALFGMAMVVIGARLSVSGSGLELVNQVASLLAQETVAWLGLLFMVGFWAAVFSSLLGVWQSVPYLFADLYYRLRRCDPPTVGLSSSPAYRWYLAFLALAPLALQGRSLGDIALVYAVLGSLFMPFLAATLLYLNGWKRRGEALENPWWINAGLLITLAFFSYQGALELLAKL